MRKFLKNITIVGALLVSRSEDILHYTIPNLLKWCDWILIMFDNENEKTKQIVLDYQKKYPDRIRISYSGFPRATEEQEKIPGGLFKRFRPLQPYIRDTVFKYLHQIVKSGEKIDIILWPDDDEVFNCSFPEILTDFWNSNKKGLYSKYISVFDKMNILIRKSQPPDVIAYKQNSKLSAIPYRHWQIYEPLTRDDLFPTRYTRIHLAYLNMKKRNWRKDNWRPDPFRKHDKKMWFLKKDVRDMTSDDIENILKYKNPDTNLDDYLDKK